MKTIEIIFVIYATIILIHWLVFLAGTGLKNIAKVAKGRPERFEFIAKLIGSCFWPIVWSIDLGKVLWLGLDEYKKRG